jgi:hypothetical protein
VRTDGFQALKRRDNVQRLLTLNPRQRVEVNTRIAKFIKESSHEAA